MQNPVSNVLGKRQTQSVPGMLVGEMDAKRSKHDSHQPACHLQAIFDYPIDQPVLRARRTTDTSFGRHLDRITAETFQKNRNAGEIDAHVENVDVDGPQHGDQDQDTPNTTHFNLYRTSVLYGSRKESDDKDKEKNGPPSTPEPPPPAPGPQNDEEEEENENDEIIIIKESGCLVYMNPEAEQNLQQESNTEVENRRRVLAVNLLVPLFTKPHAFPDTNALCTRALNLILNRTNLGDTIVPVNHKFVPCDDRRFIFEMDVWTNWTSAFQLLIRDAYDWTLLLIDQRETTNERDICRLQKYAGRIIQNLPDFLVLTNLSRESLALKPKQFNGTKAQLEDNFFSVFFKNTPEYLIALPTPRLKQAGFFNWLPQDRDYVGERVKTEQQLRELEDRFRRVTSTPTYNRIVSPAVDIEIKSYIVHPLRMSHQTAQNAFGVPLPAMGMYLAGLNRTDETRLRVVDNFVRYYMHKIVQEIPLFGIEGFPKASLFGYEDINYVSTAWADIIWLKCFAEGQDLIENFDSIMKGKATISDLFVQHHFA
jgi:hypothetical protein